MSTHCSNKSKAIITLNFKDGSKEAVTSNNPAVEVSLNGSGSTATKKVYLRGFAFSDGSQCNQLPNYEEYRGEIPINVQPTLSQGSGGTCDGGSSRSYYINEVGGNSGTEWRVGSVSIREEYSVSNCEVTITDANGTIYTKTINDNCPTYTVACNDDCPAGQERIPTIEYPGYKCREKCPPETCCECECDCGDIICCYGSQGQVLKTILK